jgi:hypothetical protein
VVPYNQTRDNTPQTKHQTCYASARRQQADVATALVFQGDAVSTQQTISQGLTCRYFSNSIIRSILLPVCLRSLQVGQSCVTLCGDRVPLLRYALSNKDCLDSMTRLRTYRTSLAVGVFYEPVDVATNPPVTRRAYHGFQQVQCMLLMFPKQDIEMRNANGDLSSTTTMLRRVRGPRWPLQRKQ